MNRRLLWCALLLWGCPASHSVKDSPPRPIEVAITVDDLPRHRAPIATHPPLAIAQSMLEAFERHRVPKVYGFINGQRLEGREEDVSVLHAWVAHGHPLGNHGWDHADLHKVPVEEYLSQISRNEPLLRQLQPGLPERSWKVFRYPFLREGMELDKRDQVRTYLRNQGYRIAPVTIDPYDWAYGDAYERCVERGMTDEAEAIRATFMSEARAKLRWAVAESEHLVGRPIRQVLLLHAGALNADTTEALLTDYEQQGVRWISLEEALGDPAYQEDPKVQYGGMFLFQLFQARGKAPPPPPLTPTPLLRSMCLPPT